ncbi:MAG: TadG family pilus assembly protein [Hyphomicrobiales bacterium]
MPLRNQPARMDLSMRRLARCREGAVAIVSALAVSVILWCVACAVDIGSLYLERRTAQGAVDLAAMAAARDIANAERLARETLDANHVSSISLLTVTPGHYSADPGIDPSARFTAGAQPFNAVHVRMRNRAPLHLAGAVMGVRSWEIGTEAVATTTAQGAFSIGSRLARIEGGLLNSTLGAMLGGNLSLTVMDYEALADANIKLFEFMDALASELNITAGTYNDVLGANASVAQVLDAMAEVASNGGDAEAAAALRALGAQAGPSVSVPLGSLVDAGPYGGLSLHSGGPGFSPSVNAMQLVSAAAAIANGDNQVSLNLGAAIPGLANVRVDMAVGEPPQHSAWYTVGERGAVVRTAQTRLRILTEIAPGALLPGVSVRVPLYAEVAYGEARLDDVSCGADPERDARATIAARPGVAELWLGEVSSGSFADFSGSPQVSKANLVQIPLLKVTGSAHAAITNVHETELEFDWGDVEDGTVRSASTHDILTTLLGSLVGDLDVDVQVGGLGLSLPGVIAGVVRTALAAATPALDRLIGSLLQALGVTVGEVDIRMHGIRCDGSALVG